MVSPPSQALVALVAAWRVADHVLIGAGAGLSVAAGVDYGDAEDFRRTFPVMHAEGFRARYQMIGRWGLPPERHWAYWSTHVHSVRFQARSSAVYTQLSALLSDRDHFVLSSNVDGLFERHGLDPRRVVTTQGDYAAMQCRTPCRQVVWPSQPAVERLLGTIDATRFVVRDPEALPRCPHCGGEVFLNVRADASFVEAPYEAPRQQLADWLRISTGRMLVVELGAGHNTPMVIRWPLERLTLARPNTTMFRINPIHWQLPSELHGRATSVVGDAGEVVAGWHREAARGREPRSR
mgnify:CR=1 FL=1